MPRYAALIYGAEPAGESANDSELWGQIMAEYMHFGEAGDAAGVLKGGEALQPTNTATTIQVTGGAKGGDVIATDGPFAETKEALGGFYILDCKDLDEAIVWAAQIPGAWRGRVEVRPLIEFGG
ncbi:MAG: YciI family protein [Ilumatobacteraceae bacterium]